MAKFKRSSNPSTNPQTDDVCPLIAPCELSTPINSLGYHVAHRATTVSWCFHQPEFAGLQAHQSLLSGEEFQHHAEDEREAWPEALDSLSHLYGKPLTREMAFQILAPAMAAVAIASVELHGVWGPKYEGGWDASDCDQYDALCGLQTDAKLRMEEITHRTEESREEYLEKLTKFAGS